MPLPSAIRFADTAEYVDFAERLPSEPVGGDILGFTRVKSGPGGRAEGDIVRYDLYNDWSAAMSRDGTTKTFFQPDEGVDYYLTELELHGPYFTTEGMVPPEEKP